MVELAQRVDHEGLKMAYRIHCSTGLKYSLFVCKKVKSQKVYLLPKYLFIFNLLRMFKTV